MAGNALAMMPWFPRDFMASTRHMTLLERGAYRELLDYQWEMGALPTDAERLARLLGLTGREFGAVWKVISGKFEAVEGGIANRRLEEHRAKALEQRERKVRGAEIANAKRGAQRFSERDAERALEGGGRVIATRTPPSPSPSPSPSVPSEPPPSGERASSDASPARVNGFHGEHPETQPAKPKPKREKRGPLAHRVPADFEVPDPQAEWAKREFPAVDLYAETQKFRDHEFAVARSDWLAAWRNWMRRAAEKPAPGTSNGRR